MKKLCNAAMLLPLLVLLLSSRPITIGTQSTGSNSYIGANALYKYSSAEFIIDRKELSDSASGITSISLYKTSGDSSISGIDSVHIYFKESDSLLSNKLNLSGYTEVYGGSIPNLLSTGWVTLTLPTTFSYSGSHNLAVVILRKNGSKWTSNIPNYSVSYSVDKIFDAAYFNSDRDPWKGSTTSYQTPSKQYRPNIRLEM